ncbi:alpha/beta fold hydrolase [Pseudomonas sp. Gutcm_11s]|uniref:alpha/beta fold hydrolase n=1 Tax=Pseudomonas sp. Gutcm_11s TaxID=3026088 RepID=UPI00235E61C9|nr:alpha/beta hydrolase [Pseudomonas sp. Gutcm_11s]MDD0841327.1 alpha/beta hydrolase [Pseudomonas sp. Gutcm_11s]
MKKLTSIIAVLGAAAAAVLYFSPTALLATTQLLERRLAGLSTKDIRVGEFDIRYYEGGPADGETLLMLHGFGGNRDTWLRFSRPLTERYHVIALDLPGFGESSKPEVGYDVASQVERLHALTQALGIRKLHLIGNSMGGHIAALYSARYGDEVLSLALLNNAGVTAPTKSEMFQRIQRGEPNPLVVRKPEDFDTVMQFVFANPPSMPESLKRHFAAQSMANRVHYDQIFSQLRENYVPLEPELPKIQAPTLLLWGDRDRVLDISSIEVMKPLLQKPSVVIMKDCGHVPMLERPEETAQHYQDFLDANRG